MVRSSDSGSGLHATFFLMLISLGVGGGVMLLAVDSYRETLPPRAQAVHGIDARDFPHQLSTLMREDYAFFRNRTGRSP